MDWLWLGVWMVFVREFTRDVSVTEFHQPQTCNNSTHKRYLACKNRRLPHINIVSNGSQAVDISDRKTSRSSHRWTERSLAINLMMNDASKRSNIAQCNQTYHYVPLSIVNSSDSCCGKSHGTGKWNLQNPSHSQAQENIKVLQSTNSCCARPLLLEITAVEGYFCRRLLQLEVVSLTKNLPYLYVRPWSARLSPPANSLTCTSDLDLPGSALQQTFLTCTSDLDLICQAQPSSKTSWLVCLTLIWRTKCSSILSLILHKHAWAQIECMGADYIFIVCLVFIEIISLIWNISKT